MIGKGKKYRYLDNSSINFPKTIHLMNIPFRNEREFLEFLIRNYWIQRMLGIEMYPTTGHFPDIRGKIIDKDRLDINVEVEYWAENYKFHNHPFQGCNLIISFFRTPEVRFVKGIPVWSFYKGYKNDLNFKYTLNEDINTDWDKLCEERDNHLITLIKRNTEQ